MERFAKRVQRQACLNYAERKETKVNTNVSLSECRDKLAWTMPSEKKRRLQYQRFAKRVQRQACLDYAERKETKVAIPTFR